MQDSRSWNAHEDLLFFRVRSLKREHERSRTVLPGPDITVRSRSRTVMHRMTMAVCTATLPPLKAEDGVPKKTSERRRVVCVSALVGAWVSKRVWGKASKHSVDGGRRCAGVSTTQWAATRDAGERRRSEERRCSGPEASATIRAEGEASEHFERRRWFRGDVGPLRGGGETTRWTRRYVVGNRRPESATWGGGRCSCDGAACRSP